jgi:hypothetical protein
MPIGAGGVLLALLASLVLAGTFAGNAHSAMYKMLLCAGNNGSNSFGTSTNTAHSGNPGGIFDFTNNCGPAPDPAGDSAFLRIREHEDGGNANLNAYGYIYYDTPNYVHFRTAGGYTRQPFQFNDGWRSRMWGIDFGGQAFEIIRQGAGLDAKLPEWPIHSTFGSHIWPISGYRDFWRFGFELKCVRSAECERKGNNATDLNSILFTLNDDQNSMVNFTGNSTFITGGWVRGNQTLTFNSSDNGSGLRTEQVRVDNKSEFWRIDHNCNVGFSSANGEWARVFQPCPTGGPYGRSLNFNTAAYADGGHSLHVCTKDYGQFQGWGATGSETCDQRTIHVDNTAPGAPSGLSIASANPNRYLDHFAAHYSLPANSGSPITKIHYNIVNAANEVVTPEQTVSGTDLTELKEVVAPKAPGDYRLRVWLEDQVGWVGPASATAIPRDTTPPAAPQDIAVTAPSKSRADDGFDLRWRNIVDQGAPIDAMHYQVLNGAGAVVVPTQVATGPNIEVLPNLESPEDRGKYTLQMWLSDSEGNIGAPVDMPLAYECVRSNVKAGDALTSGLGVSASETEVVHEGSGSTFRGRLKAAGGGGTSTAPVCVFSRVITDQPRDFLGLAVTGQDGAFQFPIRPGASRDVIAVYRRDHRELVSRATLQTIVHPTFKARKNVIFNKRYARFFGQIPGPHNDRVVIVLQAKVGKGWSAFRRYRTRNDGKFTLSYRFRRTFQRTKYTMRAQVRQTVGYPYLQGNSRRLTLTVLPKR